MSRFDGLRPDIDSLGYPLTVLSHTHMLLFLLVVTTSSMNQACFLLTGKRIISSIERFIMISSIVDVLLFVVYIV